AADDVPATVLMKPGGDRGPDRPTEPIKRPEPAPGEEATVLLKASKAAGGTAAAAKGAVPQAGKEGGEATVLMGAVSGTAPPSAPPAARTGGKSPVPPAQPGGESTVLMGAPTVSQRPPDVTVKAPTPTRARTGGPTDTRPPGPAAPPAPTVRAPAPPIPVPPAPGPAQPAGPGPARPPGKGGMGLAAIAIGALLLIGLLVGGLLLLRSLGRGSDTAVASPPPAAPGTVTPAVTPPPPVVTAGSVHVESTPPGATVTVDGQARGVTPVDVTGLALGTHEVKVELRGFAPVTQTVELTAATPRVDFTAPLSRSAPATGAAEVISQPPGATVVIDGTPSGQTPFSAPRLRAGLHQVELRRDGYEVWTGTIDVQAGKKARLDAALRPVAQKPTPPPVEPVDPNRIYVNSPAEVDAVARKASGASAAYPSDRAPRMKSGESVSVRVSFVVTESGDVTDIKVVESAGRIIDEAVVSAVRGWKYTPALKQGQKVKVRVEFRQTFRAG
ncbi:MAG TPA: TonB family protein, partial [Vicinamibacteria bacterium]|nr:TonB family protein [Vicinamibacteria bacterium]